MPSRLELANAIRALSMDAVQQAESGHPGAPMGMAEIAEVLWNDFLVHNPGNPRWFNRDRFVLSNGHGSMLLYSLLHLSGYDLPIEQLQAFRQIPLADAGTPGVRRYARRRNHHRPARPGHRQRGGHGAGGEDARGALQPPRPRPHRPPHLRLRRRRLPDGGHLARGLLAGGDAGAGQADRALRRQRHLDRRQRRRAGSPTTPRSASRPTAGKCLLTSDGHDFEAITAALHAARADDKRPSLIACRTVIGWGAPNKQGTEHVHGSPLGTAEVAAARETLGWHARAVPRAAGDPRRVGCARARRRRRGAMAGTPGRVPRRLAGRGCRARAAHARRAAGRLRAGCRRLRARLPAEGRDHRQPQGLAERDPGAGPAAAGTHRRLGRPRAVQPHAVEGGAWRRRRRCQRQLHLLRGARVRHGRHHERAGAARGRCAPSAAPSWCSWSTCAMPCAWPR